MHYLAENGLHVVKFNQRFRHFNAGEVGGLSPSDAAKVVEKGVASYAHRIRLKKDVEGKRLESAGYGETEVIAAGRIVATLPEVAKRLISLGEAESCFVELAEKAETKTKTKAEV